MVDENVQDIIICLRVDVEHSIQLNGVIEGIILLVWLVEI